MTEIEDQNEENVKIQKEMKKELKRIWEKVTGIENSQRSSYRCIPKVPKEENQINGTEQILKAYNPTKFSWSKKNKQKLEHTSWKAHYVPGKTNPKWPTSRLILVKLMNFKEKL